MTLSKHATTAATIGDELIVTYHQTVIVKATKKEVTINFGHVDYITATTVKKINQASQDYNLGFSVKREKGVVYVYQGNGFVVSLKPGQVSHTFPAHIAG